MALREYQALASPFEFSWLNECRCTASYEDPAEKFSEKAFSWSELFPIPPHPILWVRRLQPTFTQATYRDGWALYDTAWETYSLFILKSVRTLLKNKQTKPTHQTKKKKQKDQTCLQMAAGQRLLQDISHQGRDSKLCPLNAVSCEFFKHSWRWLQDDFIYFFSPEFVKVSTS